MVHHFHRRLSVDLTFIEPTFCPIGFFVRLGPAGPGLWPTGTGPASGRSTWPARRCQRGSEMRPYTRALKMVVLPYGKWENGGFTLWKMGKWWFYHEECWFKHVLPTNRLGQYTTACLTLIFIHNTNRRGETVTSFRNSVVAGVDDVHGEYRGEALTEGITIDFFTDITFGSPSTDVRYWTLHRIWL